MIGSGGISFERGNLLGVDRSQAACVSEAFDLVKEIGQTCDRSATVRMKDKTQAQLASLTQTRDTLVKLRTALKNKINNILSAHGINLEKEALSSDKKLNEVLAMQFDPMVRIELKVIVEQIRSLNQSIAELEKTIAERGQQTGGTQKPDQHQGDRPADREHSAVGDRRHPRLCG